MLVAALLLSGGTERTSRSSAFNLGVALGVAALTAPPDTLRSSATTGTPLIRSLPAQLNNKPVSRYVLLEAPALSGVAGRSFAWIPEGTNPGTHDVRFRAQHPNAEPDTLVLRIELTS